MQNKLFFAIVFLIYAQSCSAQSQRELHKLSSNRNVNRSYEYDTVAVATSSTSVTAGSAFRGQQRPEVLAIAKAEASSASQNTFKSEQDSFRRPKSPAASTTEPTFGTKKAFERRQQPASATHRREPQTRDNTIFEADNIIFPGSKQTHSFGASERDEIVANREDSDEGNGSNRRLCEIKYAEYIARIYSNDADTTADANESNFDGRELAIPGEYPHMTAVGFEGKNGIIEYKCGGSLISDNFVVTAAHCTNVTGDVPTKVRIGDWNLKVAEQLVQPAIQIRNIQHIFNHPRYESHMFYNDIALLRLSTSVDFTEFVRPIRLWVRPDLPFSVAYAMGYGATSFARAPTNHLTYFNISLVNNIQCNNQLPKMPETPHGIIDSQICAQDFEKQRDTCQGDSGGPLQYNIRGRRRRERRHYHLIGITSFGIVCRSPYPGVYTRVFTFLDWIEGIVWSG